MDVADKVGDPPDPGGQGTRPALTQKPKGPLLGEETGESEAETTAFVKCAKTVRTPPHTETTSPDNGTAKLAFMRLFKGVQRTPSISDLRCVEPDTENKSTHTVGKRVRSPDGRRPSHYSPFS